MRRIFILLTVCIACLTVQPVLSDSFHDSTDPAATGGITGKVKGAELQKVVAIEQVAFKFYAGWVDRTEGSYSITGLPPGKYDIFLKFEEDVVEGLRLDVFGETEEIGKEDRDKIWDLIKVSDDFFHDKRIVRSGGTAKLQKLIVEQIRTKPTFNPDGTIAEGKMFRRIDYTIVKKTREVWQIDPDCPRFILREERDNKGKGSKVTYRFNKDLGGLRVADEMVTAPDVVLEKKENKK